MSEKLTIGVAIFRLAFPLLLSAFLGCSAPPYMSAKPASTPVVEAPGPGLAKVVVLRPVSSCERAGHYVVVDETGRLHGALVAGSSLETTLPAGKHLLFAWNPRREESALPHPTDTGVLPMQLEAGKVYHVLLGFSLNMDGSPVDLWAFSRGRRFPVRVCGPNPGELHPLSPSRPYWDQVSAWTTECKPYVLDPSQAQTWESSHSLEIRDHIEWGMTRLRRFSSSQLQYRMVESSDGLDL